MEVAESGLGSGSVYLAHVLTLVAPLYIPDVQVPHAVPVVAHSDSGIPRDNIVLHSEDRTPVIVDPSNLRTYHTHVWRIVEFD